MKTRRTPAPAGDSRKQPAAVRSNPARTFPRIGAGELRQFKTSKDLLEKQLTGPFGTIIKELTGLELHVLWHGPFDDNKSGRMLRLCPESRDVGGADGSVPPELRSMP